MPIPLWVRYHSIPLSLVCYRKPLGPDAFEIEIGARYVHGWGRFQRDLALPGVMEIANDEIKRLRKACRDREMAVGRFKATRRTSLVIAGQ